MNAASGDYIVFVDSDDEINKNMYKEMMKAAENEHADIVICDVLLNEESIGGKHIIQHSVNFGEYSKENYLSSGIKLCSSCNKLFKRHIFEGEEFKCITYEDMALIPVLISKAERISFVKKHYYHYIRHNDSTTTDREFHTEDLFEAIISSIEGAREEHRPLLTYWHARSLIHLANGERKEYIAELSAVLKHNIQLFFDNDLIRDDPYTEKIIDGRLVQPMNCAEIPDMSLTVISDLNKKFIMDDFR